MTDTTSTADTTSTGPTLRWAHQIAPEPAWDWQTPASVEDHLRSLLARARGFQAGMEQLIADRAGEDTDRPLWVDWSQKYAATALTALLLHRLVDEYDTPQEAINWAHNALCDGDIAAETIWQQLKARLVDPDTIRPYLPRWYVKDLTVEGLGDWDETRWVMARGHHDRAAFHAHAARFLDVPHGDLLPAEEVKHVWATYTKVDDDQDDSDGYWTWDGITARTPGAQPLTVLDALGNVA